MERALSEANFKHFQLWLEAKLPAGLPACPICSSHGSDAYAGALPVGDAEPPIPLVLVICRKCAYVMQFSARQIGLEL